MADPLLEFDPTSEDAANSPLSVWNTASYIVTAFNPDAANQTVQWASSVDTEGALPGICEGREPVDLDDHRMPLRGGAPVIAGEGHEDRP
jgi:hypothetical protein